MVNTNSGDFTPKDLDKFFNPDKATKKPDGSTTGSKTLGGKTISKSDAKLEKTPEFKFGSPPDDLLGPSAHNELKERKISLEEKFTFVEEGINAILDFMEMDEKEAKKNEDYINPFLLGVEREFAGMPPMADLEDSATTHTPAVIHEVFTKTLSPPEPEKSPPSTATPDKNALTSLFSLDLLPTLPKDSVTIRGETFTPQELSKRYQNANNEKIKFIRQHLTESTIPTIASQTRVFSIMNAALTKLVDNLNTWTDLQFSRETFPLDELKDDIAHQLKNLAVLSEIISSATPNDEDKLALATMSLESALSPKGGSEIKTASFERIVDLFLSGKSDLTQPEPRKFLDAVIKKYIEQFKTEIPLEQPSKDYQEKRKQASVTLDAIRLQADLIKSVREAKAWAAAEPTPLVKQGIHSVNTVFQLRHPTKPETLAFYKVGAGGEQAAGTMEKLMWDAAVLMGMENQFVPTGTTIVRTESELTGGTEKSVTWNSKGERLEVNTAREAPRGGIQIAQKGAVLQDYLQTPSIRRTTASISQEEIVNATITSLVFGMFDAHNNNIFVTERGDLKFFDNTRSLPHSNGFINRGQGIVSSYRCGLLCLPEATMTLTPDQIDHLKITVAGYKEKMNGLKKFFEQPTTQKQLKQLPEGWMWHEKSLNAMSERLDNMERALGSGKPMTLEQLALETIPSYKFAFAISLLNSISKSHFSTAPVSLGGSQLDAVRKHVHQQVGYYVLEEELKRVAELGYDVNFIKSYCGEKDASIDSIWTIVKALNNKLQKTIPTYFELDRILLDKEKILGEITRNSASDYKDFPREHCKAYVCTHNIETFTKRDIPIPFYGAATLSEGILIADNLSLSQMLLKCGDSYHIIYKTATGYRAMENVDLTSKQSKIVYNNQESPIEDLLNAFNDEDVIQSPPKWSQLPSLSFGELISMVKKKSPGEIIFAKDKDGDSLVLGLYIEGEPEELMFARGTTEGTYLDGGEELTARELMEKYQGPPSTIPISTAETTSLTDQNLQEFSKRGVGLIEASKVSEGILYANRENISRSLLKCEDTYYLIFKSFTGYNLGKVDLNSDKGEVLLDTAKFPIGELVHLLETEIPAEPPILDVLPVLTFDELQEFMIKLAPGQVFLSKDEDLQSLVICYNDRGGVYSTVLKPGTSQGTFIDGSEEFTIEELIEKYESPVV